MSHDAVNTQSQIGLCASSGRLTHLINQALQHSIVIADQVDYLGTGPKP